MKAQGKVAIPLALFLDGVQYANRDSMLVINVTNLLTEQKHVVAVLRKRLMCGKKASCGCRGWCSLWPLWQFLSWSLGALAVATYPRARHSTAFDTQQAKRTGWRADEKHRLQQAGSEMEYAGAVLQVRADWGEMTTSLGVAYWSTVSDPCFLCGCSREAMFERDLLQQRVPFPWQLRTFAGYDDACKTCETVVDCTTMDDTEWQKVKDSLRMDTHVVPHRGRTSGGARDHTAGQTSVFHPRGFKFGKLPLNESQHLLKSQSFSDSRQTCPGALGDTPTLEPRHFGPHRLLTSKNCGSGLGAAVDVSSATSISRKKKGGEKYRERESERERERDLV